MQATVCIVPRFFDRADIFNDRPAGVLVGLSGWC